ncbi:peptidoglycan recognition protein family protein [Actinomadura miaoliensis]|uniref:N-acetylmuramoyl-L-alanine amidase n=1 Tax=Actinomadura miaoliensis TaxID=430685 RepID=A0ABP7W773_9ACTN
MDIISRKEWGARTPRSRPTTTWSRRTEFVVHYSEGPTTQTPRQIQDFHLDSNGWADIGYNFLVDTRGRVYEGRGWLVVGAHATGHNTSGIGVCMIGRDGDATDAAKKAIRWLYDEACRRKGAKLAKRGHRDVTATSCPGKQLYEWVQAGMPVSGGGSDWMEDAVKKLPILRKGDKGEHVETLRGLLLARSHPEVNTVEGTFDTTVESAVRAVQKWGGVDVDGIVGPQTWPVLLRVHQ